MLTATEVADALRPTLTAVHTVTVVNDERVAVANQWFEIVEVTIDVYPEVLEVAVSPTDEHYRDVKVPGDKLTKAVATSLTVAVNGAFRVHGR